MAYIKGDIYLGATSGTVQLMSPFGRKLNIEDIELSRSQRASSGKLRRDRYGPTKHKITLTYEAIDGDELEKYLTLYETYDELVLQIYHYPDGGTTEEPSDNYDEYNVIMEPISRERLSLKGDGLWSNVSIVFNEV
jgi:hypothetical protein